MKNKTFQELHSSYIGREGYDYQKKKDKLSRKGDTAIKKKDIYSGFLEILYYKKYYKFKKLLLLK